MSLLIRFFCLFACFHPFHSLKAQVNNNAQTKALIVRSLDEKKTYGDGESFKAELIFFPAKLFSSLKTQSLRERILENRLYLLSVGPLRVSENNSDALVARAQVIVLPEVMGQGRPVLFSKKKDEKISVKWQNFSLGGEALQIDQRDTSFEIIETEYKTSWSTLSVVLVSTLSLGICLFAALFFRKNQRRVKEMSLRKKNFEEMKNLILKASTREDFEDLYKRREEIQKIAETSELKRERLFEAINKIQYKKNVNTADLQEVSSFRDDFIKIFTQKGGYHGV